jgi:transposase
VAELIRTVKATEPVEHELPGYGWSLKKIRRWVKQVMGGEVSRSTLRTLLKQKGLSWKKCQKVLKKAKPEQRTAFVAEFQQIFSQVCREEVRLIYIDEAHFHRDMELGYIWATTGKPAWRLSDCPPLSDRLNWYGAYDFVQAQCFIWNEGSCNQANTVQFLHQLAEWLGPLSIPVLIIWDGAPWHKATLVQAAAADLGFILQPLPAYSPDLNPIEGLWKWLREDVTQNHCHLTMRQLFDACKAFIERINAAPEQLLSRLWPKFELDPEFEKLLVSN